jgi:DNA-binding NarL/FixJ family response regulator
VTTGHDSASEAMERKPILDARDLRVFAKDDNAVGGGAASPRILIVEDDYLVALELQAGLVNAGFDVVGVAMSADEAISLAKVEQPVLAIVDVRLAGRRDGVDAAIELFRDHGVRCIFATAHADPETRARAQPAAPFAWLAKPYSASRLIPLVREALSAAK